MKRNSGFTLIELLLVIGIITLLSSVFFYNVTEAKKKAEDSKMISESHEVQTAIELYKMDHNGKVPSMRAKGIMVQEGDKDGTYAAEYEVAMGQLVPKYLREIPKSPSGNSYAYGTDLSGESAVFVANLNYYDPICKTAGDSDFNRTGTGDSCDGILEDEDTGGGGGSVIAEDDPYTLSGYNRTFILKTNKLYTVTLEGGSSAYFEIEGTSYGMVIESWFVYSGNSFFYYSPNSDWYCEDSNINEGETGNCWGISETIEITNFDQQAGIIKIKVSN